MQVMTDIEIFGGDGVPNILQISSVAFDMDGKVNDPHELLQVEDCWFDAVIPGWPEAVDESAVDWWSRSEQETARTALLGAASSRGEGLVPALERYEKFLRPRLGKKGGHWANPPGFDLDTIRKHYGQCLIYTPWRRSQERCMRTAMSLVKSTGAVKLPDMSDVGLIRHNGLHDAVRQAVLVQAAYRTLGLRAGDYQRASKNSDRPTV